MAKCLVCNIPLGNTNRTGHCTSHRGQAKSNRDYKAEWYQRNKDKVRERRKATRDTWDSTYSRFRITAKDYLELLEKQGGLCAICYKHPKDDYRRRLSVDHCHKSNTVRGLLCNMCNLMLGHAKDVPNILDKGAKYLREHELDKTAQNANNSKSD